MVSLCGRNWNGAFSDTTKLSAIQRNQIWSDFLVKENRDQIEWSTMPEVPYNWRTPCGMAPDHQGGYTFPPIASKQKRSSDSRKQRRRERHMMRDAKDMLKMCGMGDPNELLDPMVDKLRKRIAEYSSGMGTTPSSNTSLVPVRAVSIQPGEDAFCCSTLRNLHQKRQVHSVQSRRRPEPRVPREPITYQKHSSTMGLPALDRIMGFKDTRHLRAPIGSKVNPLTSVGSTRELQIDGDMVTKPDGTRVCVDANTDIEQLVRGPRPNYGQWSSDHMQGTGSGWCRFV